MKIIKLNEVSEPSMISRNGHSFNDNPKHWKELEAYVFRIMNDSNFECIGRSRWGSIWEDPNTGEKVKLDYWEDKLPIEIQIDNILGD